MLEIAAHSLAFVAGLKRATDEGSSPEIAQYSPYYITLNVFTAPVFFILQLALCRMSALKSLPVYHP